MDVTMAMEDEERININTNEWKKKANANSSTGDRMDTRRSYQGLGNLNTHSSTGAPADYYVERMDGQQLWTARKPYHHSI
jgi:hypothetical protein